MARMRIRAAVSGTIPRYSSLFFFPVCKFFYAWPAIINCHVTILYVIRKYMSQTVRFHFLVLSPPANYLIAACFHILISFCFHNLCVFVFILFLVIFLVNIFSVCPYLYNCVPLTVYD